MIAAALLLLAQHHEPLPAYADSSRCSGLVAAASKLHKDRPDWRIYYDALIFWSMAASERARKDGLSSKKFEADQTAEQARALPQLEAADAAAMAELDACMKRVPPLK